MLQRYSFFCKYANIGIKFEMLTLKKRAHESTLFSIIL